MKRFLIPALIVVYCAAVFVLDYRGADIREYLAPRVEVCRMNDCRYGQYLPKAAVRIDEDGQAYIMCAAESSRYPEKGYEAVRVDCMLAGEDDEYLIELRDSGVISEDEALIFTTSAFLTYNSKPILSSDKEVVERRRVIIVN